jgi:hypothetical protein
MQVWTSPLINALETNDARALQGIFYSLSKELEKMSKEIMQLKIDVSKSSRSEYERTI